MSKYSRTTLATIAALQTKRRPPITVFEKALISHLYPFYHYEYSSVTGDSGIDKHISGNDVSKESSNIDFSLSFTMYSSVIRLPQYNEVYDTNVPNFIFNITVVDTTPDEIAPIDIYDSSKVFIFNMDASTINFVNTNAEDTYDSSTLFSFNLV